jgi:DNA-binding GntR family transcriptional regulator
VSIRELALEAAGRNKTTHEIVADALRKGILGGVLEGGQPLRQRDIAKEFGVSSIPVREALRQLEGEGLVTFNPYRGATVSELSYEEVSEICEIKLALEPLALRLAVPNYTEDDLHLAKETLDQADSAETGADYAELSRRFHSVLYAPAGRPRLLAILQPLDTAFDRYVRIYLEVMHTKAQAQEEHRKILECCKQRDADAAVRALEEHITSTADRIQAYLEKEKPESTVAREER